MPFSDIGFWNHDVMWLVMSLVMAWFRLRLEMKGGKGRVRLGVGARLMV